MGADLPAVAAQLVVVHLLHGIGHGAHPIHHIAARGVLNADIAAVFARDRADAALYQLFRGPAQRRVDIRCAGEGLCKSKVHDFVVGFADGIELAVRTGRPQIFQQPVRALGRDPLVGCGQLLQLAVILKSHSPVQNIPKQHVYGSGIDAGLLSDGCLDLLFSETELLSPVYLIFRRGGDGPSLFTRRQMSSTRRSRSGCAISEAYSFTPSGQAAPYVMPPVPALPWPAYIFRVHF